MLKLTMSWGEKKKQKHPKIINRVGSGEGNRFNREWLVSRCVGVLIESGQ